MPQTSVSMPGVSSRMPATRIRTASGQEGVGGHPACEQFLLDAAASPPTLVPRQPGSAHPRHNHQQERHPPAGVRTQEQQERQLRERNEDERQQQEAE